MPGLFNNLQGDLINHTHYIGKPIIVQQQNRVQKKKLAQNVRRRDLPLEKQNQKMQRETNSMNTSNVMSDLKDFMMAEDLKIDQQEQKFIQQA